MTQDRGPRPPGTSEMGSLPDTQEGRDEGHGTFTAASVYVQVADPEFVVFCEFEGHWSQSDPFTFKTQEEAEARIAAERHFHPPSFIFHVVKRTTIDEAVT